MIHDRLGCSSISFRHLALSEALSTISGLGFAEIDLGALPGVCDHVPFGLDAPGVEQVIEEVAASGLRVRSVNGDIGDLNLPPTSAQRDERKRHLDQLLALAAGVEARALVLPCGALDHTPVRSLDEDLDVVAAQLEWAAETARVFGVALWTESLHVHRLCCDIARATQLTARFSPEIGIVMDFSHIVASGGDPVDFVHLFGRRISHVHLRDAVPGNINLSLGNGSVDFAAGIEALADFGYAGHFSLELETRDVTHDRRPDSTARAARFISPLIP
ncbi:sugar phosphate isomerase/epimerase family protein [Rhodococcus rhodochrous]|uniref:Xylose isomerase n=1 Tax=Rhodococcus rhodochrous KG-21 TaxID=1441923 RepID=A0A0M8PIS1_RHORH|nr:sugar phosphate isomerase/epimerase [Rhodococcus rhodochrous]KOS55775.1 xylose isomerase [Rhodococcus rhodochrous KG-21]